VIGRLALRSLVLVYDQGRFHLTLAFDLEAAPAFELKMIFYQFRRGPG
jgi:hypothetical protein